MYDVYSPVCSIGNLEDYLNQGQGESPGANYLYITELYYTCVVTCTGVKIVHAYQSHNENKRM